MKAASGVLFEFSMLSVFLFGLYSGGEKKIQKSISVAKIKFAEPNNPIPAPFWNPRAGVFLLKLVTKHAGLHLYLIFVV